MKDIKQTLIICMIIGSLIGVQYTSTPGNSWKSQGHDPHHAEGPEDGREDWPEWWTDRN